MAASPPVFSAALPGTCLASPHRPLTSSATKAEPIRSPGCSYRPPAVQLPGAAQFTMSGNPLVAASACMPPSLAGLPHVPFFSLSTAGHWPIFMVAAQSPDTHDNRGVNDRAPGTGWALPHTPVATAAGEAAPAARAAVPAKPPMTRPLNTTAITDVTLTIRAERRRIRFPHDVRTDENPVR